MKKNNCWLEQSPEKSTVSTVQFLLGHPVFALYFVSWYEHIILVRFSFCPCIYVSKFSCILLTIKFRGGSRIFQKKKCAKYYVQARSPLQPGSGSSRVLDVLSCFLSLSFKHSDTKLPKLDKKKNIADQKLKGARACCRPPPPPGLDPPQQIWAYKRKWCNLAGICTNKSFTCHRKLLFVRVYRYWLDM